MRKVDLAVLVVVIAVCTGAAHYRSIWMRSGRSGFSSETQAILEKKCDHNRKLCDAVAQFYVAAARNELKDQRSFDNISDPIFSLVTKDKDIQETPSGRTESQEAETTLQQSSEHLYESFYALQATRQAEGEKRGKLLTKAHQELQWGQTLSTDATSAIESR